MSLNLPRRNGYANRNDEQHAHHSRASRTNTEATNSPQRRRDKDRDKARSEYMQSRARREEKWDAIRRGRKAETPNATARRTKELMSCAESAEGVASVKIWVPHCAFGITANATQALVLGQIIYWFDRGKDGHVRAYIIRDQTRWVRGSYADLEFELSLPSRSILTAVANLSDQGLIEKQRSNHKSLFAPRLEGILQAIAATHDDLPQIRSIPDLIVWMKLNHPQGVLVPSAVAKLARRGDDAAILSQLLYWFGSDGKFRAKIKIAGLYWVAKPYRELADMLACPESRVRRCVDRLVDNQLVERTTGGFQGKRCLLLRPDFDGITTAVHELMEESS